MTTPYEDLQARWVPSRAQVEAATAWLTENPGVSSAVVPLAHPGKEQGIWRVGQVVEHPAGVFTNRDDASEAAARHLDGRPGTVGYAYVRPDGRTSVFEEILSPESLLAGDESPVPAGTEKW